MRNIALLRAIVLLILISMAVMSISWAMKSDKQEWDELLLNFGTEMAGAVVTYSVFELAIGLREKRKAEEKALSSKRENLITQLSSTVKDVAIAAAEELRRHGWLCDGSLQGTNLFGAALLGANLGKADLRETNLSTANLQRARLDEADLQRATLTRTNLREARLCRANLRGAQLYAAEMCGAVLLEANLQEAELLGADLRQTKLFRANLRGANLTMANLQGAWLSEGDESATSFDGSTKLPDGRCWVPGTNMARFTDPNRSDFWCPDKVLLLE